MQAKKLKRLCLLPIILRVVGFALPASASEQTDSGTAMFQQLEMKWQDLAAATETHRFRIDRGKQPTGLKAAWPQTRAS